MSTSERPNKAKPTRDRDLKSNSFVQLADEVTRLRGRIKNLFAEMLSELGITEMEGLVISAIVEADRPPNVPQIGRSLGHPRQVIQRVVNDLVDYGLLEKLPNPDHKRAPLFQLTAKGKTLKQRSDALALAIADAFQESAEGINCQQLAQDLKAVRKAMESFVRAVSEEKESAE